MGVRSKVEFGELKRLADKIEKYADPDKTVEFVEEMIRMKAKKLIAKVKRRTPVNTGLLRNSWKIGDIIRNGDVYEIEVYTDIEYASHVEYGFRSHFVPGQWVGNQFVHDPTAKTGMFVGEPGKRVEGKFMMTISKKEIEREFPAYLKKKQVEFLKSIMG